MAAIYSIGKRLLQEIPLNLRSPAASKFDSGVGPYMITMKR